MDKATARIPLHNGAGVVVAYTLVDRTDVDHLTGGRRWGFDNSTGYARRGKLYMHRFILGLVPGDGWQADHRNRDKLDNRRSNLRKVSVLENRQNITARRGSTSLFRGVHWDRGRKMWIAMANKGRRTIYLGSFADESIASEVARRWRLENMPGAVD